MPGLDLGIHAHRRETPGSSPGLTRKRKGERTEQRKPAMTDMTIGDVRIIPLRVPWVDPPVFGKTKVTTPRDILVVEIETKGGLVGIGYLHVLSPSLRTIAMCLEEAIVPALSGR